MQVPAALPPASRSAPVPGDLPQAPLYPPQASELAQWGEEQKRVMSFLPLSLSLKMQLVIPVSWWATLNNKKQQQWIDQTLFTSSCLQSSQFITVLSLVGWRPEEGDVLPVSKACLRMCWVDRFDPECNNFFVKGTTPNLPDILYGGTVQDQDRYKPICQKYNNNYRFATLYDTTNRIPVFSAYTFTGPPTNYRPTGVEKESRRKQPSMIEPELNRYNNRPEMVVDHSYQAGKNDYKNSIAIKGVNRGFLFPCSHAHDLDTQKSTFTLTNIVPQVETFNGGSWKKMEDYVRTKFNTDCLNDKGEIEAYVVTGAVPSSNNKLNNRVNIPELLWTAYCCYNSKKNKWIAEAHWGENKKVKTKTLKPETLGALEKVLKKGGRVQVFPNDCPRGPKPSTNT